MVVISALSLARAQPPQQKSADGTIPPSSKDLPRKSSEWFYRGRTLRGQPAAGLRRRAYEAKMQMQQRRAAARIATSTNAPSLSTGSWIPLGPAPLASDASGNGTQDYRQVAGRVTAVAIDAADSSGNTVYIGGAQGGVWKSTNAAYAVANNVAWTPLTDNQATLSIGALAIQPGNSDPSRSVILAATGEANNSADSYFGLGILRSTDAGNSWSLVSSANGGALSFTGLGGTRMAFSTNQPNTVVAAMATSSEGLTDGAITAGTKSGLYSSVNAGQSWTYNALVDPGGATDATSATAVAYNSGAGLFFAAVRYHGFYSSGDGIHWTRLAAQPGGGALSLSACPPQSTSNHHACPIYRGEITVVPGRNEMYAWYVFLDQFGTIQDGGIWKTLNGGASWTAISGAGITNCGDVTGCGVEQATYSLELLAVPSGSATDLYAGTTNIYKCTITSNNPSCTSSPFLNLTHAYGCVPAGAPAHVHPNQHAMAAVIPGIGSDSGNELLYFANDGGVYRALNGYSGLDSALCSGRNQFDDLNQNLGSLAQFVSFSQHPTDADTLLGGTQGNGSPASAQATSDSAWINVLGGDGGFTVIDPIATSNWYASNPDLPPGGLGIQLCSGGINCNNSAFDFVVTSSTVGGDDGGFIFPYILDSGSTTAMLVGTCRVWRGPRTGGSFVALSPNFETLGSGACTGAEVNQIRALATAGPTRSSSGSSVVYATTDGLGPVEGPLYTPAGGHVWVTTDAPAGIFSFVDVTENGPQGSINPNQFPISSVAADSSDGTGRTAYVTVMGFTGGTGHVWKTTNAGASWIDFTANLPDSPANAVVVYPALGQIYVGTDIGVFASATSAPNWIELGPNPNSNQPGFLPNAAVTALGIFASGGQQLLRASTYGRGMWQFNLVVTPDYQMSISNTPLTVFAGRTATFSGTTTALNGYTSSVTLSCVAGATSPPSVCAPSPLTVTPNSKTPFSVSASGTAGDYIFNVQAVGSDTNQITHKLPVALHLINFGLTPPAPTSVSARRGTTSSTVSFQVTAAGSFNQTVSVSCSTTMANATCNLTPGVTVSPTSNVPVSMTASVDVPATAAPGSYLVTIQATTVGASSPLSSSFTLNVTSNPDFILSEPAPFPVINAGTAASTGTISIVSQDGFAGAVSLRCPTTYGAGSCSISPSSVSSFPASATLTIHGSSFNPGEYRLAITGTSGAVVHTLEVPFNVGDYLISGTQSLWASPGKQATAILTVASLYGYAGNINASCDASALPAGMCAIEPANPVTIASGGTAKLSVGIDAPNDATPGTYDIQITSRDTNGAPSHSTTISLTVSEDFVVTSATRSQTVKAGQTTGAYNLTLQPVGTSFDAPVTLACTEGLPSGAQCMFTPATPVTPGTSAVNVLMSISTGPTTAERREPRSRAVWILWASFLLAPAMVVLSSAPRTLKKAKRLLLSSLVLPLFLVLASCSGVSSASGAGGGTSPTSNPVTHLVTVSGSSPGTPPSAGHSVVVTLIVD
jgi:hypothetical protein